MAFLVDIDSWHLPARRKASVSHNNQEHPLLSTPWVVKGGRYFHDEAELSLRRRGSTAQPCVVKGEALHLSRILGIIML